MALAHIKPSDKLGKEIEKIIEKKKPQKILDIGSSDGTGSITTFLRFTNDYKPLIVGIEMDDSRFETLNEIKAENFVAIHAPTVPSSCVLTEAAVKFYFRKHPDWDCWISLGIESMLIWRWQTVQETERFAMTEGVKYAIEEHGPFDLVLLDGGDFTGACELERVYGSSVIILDDVKSMKNIENYKTLNADPKYNLVVEDMSYRNGFAIYAI